MLMPYRDGMLLGILGHTWYCRILRSSRQTARSVSLYDSADLRTHGGVITRHRSGRNSPCRSQSLCEIRCSGLRSIADRGISDRISALQTTSQPST